MQGFPYTRTGRLFTMAVLQPQRLCCAVLLLAVSVNANAYHCEGEMRSTGPERFFAEGNGTITDLETGLTWMRCALGQRWDGNTCQGKPTTYPWLSAHEAAGHFNDNGGFADAQDWRLPKLPELAGIIERHCHNPRINLDLFPATPAKLFWSANTRAQGSSMAYAMDFGPRGVVTTAKETKAFIRLVRGRD